LVVAWGALALLAGLALGYTGATGSLDVSLGVPVVAGCILCLLSAWLARRLLLGIAACLLLVAGVARSLGAAPVLSNGDVAFHAGQVAVVVGSVAAEPDVRDSGTTLLLDVTSLAPTAAPARPAHGVLQVRYSGRPAVEYGDTLQVQGRLLGLASEPDAAYRAYLRVKGVGALMAYPRLLLVSSGGGNALWSAVLRLRTALDSSIAGMLPQPESGLLSAALIGGHSSSLGPLTTPFIDAGMIHIVATSGVKVALVAGLVYRLLLPLWGLRWTFLPTLTAAASYVALTGATPAGVRAGIMWAMVLLAPLLGRRSHVLTSLALTGAAMAVISPSLIGDIGFQLSLFGTAGIALLAEPLAQRLHVLPALLREGLGVTLAAQVATVPLVAGGFGQLSLIGPLANALCLPLLALSMGLGAAGALVTLALPAAAHLAGWVVYPLLWDTEHIVLVLAAVPESFVPVPAFAPFFTALYYGLVLLAAWWLLPEVPRPALVGRLWPGTLAGPRSSPPPRLQPFPVVVAALAALAAVGWQMPSPTLYRLSFVNTGHGQAVLLQTPEHQVVLIDGGDGADSLRSALGALLPFWRRDLTLVVLSATDHAHSAGLLGLAGRYHVSLAADSGTPYPGADYALWRAALRRDGVSHLTLRTGARLRIDHLAALDVLAPAHLDPASASAPVAYRLWIGRVSLLLLNTQALDGAPAPLRADHSPAGEDHPKGGDPSGDPTRDTLVALPLLPQRGNAAWEVLAQQQPALAILPSLADAGALSRQTAPVAFPPGVGQSWQGEPGSHIDVFTDGTRYGLQIVP
jgi:competence protein ComEC